MADGIHPESPLPDTPGQLPEAKIDGPGGFKITVPLPRWAVGILAGLLILALALGGVFWGYPRVAGSVLLPQEDVIDYRETSRHDVEPDTSKETQVITFQDGVKVTVRHFHTDGCVEVLRTSQALVTDKHWLRDLSRITPPPHSAATHDDQGMGPIQSASIISTAGLFGVLGTLGKVAPYERLLPEPARLNLGLLTAFPPAPPQGAGCARTCWNPHPGQFQSWNGGANGCWLQIWRRWPEGCTHYQWYNTCYNFWDSNPDGSARVTWTCCVH